MSIDLQENTVRLQGDCLAEDAEQLLTLLQANPNRSVDLTGLRLLHTAVLQVLLALRPRLAGSAADPFVQKWLVPFLRQELK
jgi:hypothetical protein